MPFVVDDCITDCDICVNEVSHIITPLGFHECYILFLQGNFACIPECLTGIHFYVFDIFS